MFQIDTILFKFECLAFDANLRDAHAAPNCDTRAALLLLDIGDPDDVAKVQFERIVEGLARQLRSPLDRKLGRYSVSLPVFPDR